VLRHRDVVYLRPNEIAEAVMMMLPINKEDAERKLVQVRACMQAHMLHTCFLSLQLKMSASWGVSQT